MYLRDGYVAGSGILQADALGMFTVAELGGPGVIARGELMRYRAEAAWYPTALLPSQGVRREAMDDSAAREALTDGEVRATLKFRFDTAVPIESVRREARGRMVGDAIVMSPWEGRWSNYQNRGGMRVPLQRAAGLAPARGSDELLARPLHRKPATYPKRPWKSREAHRAHDALLARLSGIVAWHVGPRLRGPGPTSG
ncbi:hypothetical protein BH11PSE8_BH11PSE8_32690 [soil metagenome]